MRAKPLLLLLALLALAWPLTVSASIPSPSTSTVDPCLVLDPFGDFVFHVTVRDIAGAPVENSTVLIDLCSCVGPTFKLCPSVDCQLVAFTNVGGIAQFSIRAGGTCPLPVNIFADGVLLAIRTIASPDQNGDLVVDAVDAGIVTTKVGTSDANADFDCTGGVTSNDVAITAAHAGHNCGAVPTEEPSWGRVKSIYR